MGDYAVGSADLSNVGEQLLTRYTEEFNEQWLSYLKATQVRGYQNAEDAAAKLERNSGPQSPLLALLWIASEHTAAGPGEAAPLFQPAQHTVPPGNDGALVADSNKGYLTNLFSLQDGWKSLAQSPHGAKDTALVENLLLAAKTAKSDTNQIALNFRGDPRGQVAAAVKKILMAPVENTETLLQRLGTLGLNQQGQGLCAKLSSLKRKYPFNPNAAQDASVDEVAAIFHPEQGALWALYNAHLKDLLAPQGRRFQPKPEGSIRLSPAFVSFFNQAVAISRALYPQASAELRFAYTVTPRRITTLDRLQLRVGGQTIYSTSLGGKPLPLLWPGDNSGVKLFGMIGGTTLTMLSYPPGPWSVFRFFADATVTPDSGSGVYEWRPQTSGQPLMVDNSPVIVRYELDHGPNPPILKEGFLSTLSCVSQVTR